MQLSDGYIDLPPGKLANVVTCLEMRGGPVLRVEPLGEVAPNLVRLDAPDPARYRALVRAVGEPYLWQSPLAMSDEQIAAAMTDPEIEIYSLVLDGRDEGIAQIDFRVAGECELRLFGVTERVRGSGFGRRMMNYATARAWKRPISRFWVHTCTLDDPAAIAFYIRSGFVPYKRQIEIHDDPRLIGLLPRSAAPNVPVI